MTSHNTNGSGKLLSMLGSSLRRASTQHWLSAEDMSALSHAAQFISPHAVVVLGRLLRAGDLVADEGRRVDEWLRQPFQRSDVNWMAVFQQASNDLLRAKTSLESMMCDTTTRSLRDDVESTLFLLGRAVLVQGDETTLGLAERSLRTQTNTMDEYGLDIVLDLSVPTVPIDNTWLVRASSLDPSSWWLDGISISQLRKRVNLWCWPELGGSVARAPIRVSKHLIASESRSMPEVVACEDDMAQMGGAHGTLVARLFDGEVEVLAVGLDANDNLQPGLCVRRRGGGDAGIEAASIPQTASSRGAAGWWVPLPNLRQTAELLIRWQGPRGLLEERLAIEPRD